MDYDVVITNGTILSGDGETKADVAIRGETIAAVGPNLVARAGAGAEIIDATGRQVIPGGVDVHVHLELPFCGTVSSDDWKTGTRTTARGGVTTVIDFAFRMGKKSLTDAANNWMAGWPKACIDYCFHIAITNWDRHGLNRENGRHGLPDLQGVHDLRVRGYSGPTTARSITPSSAVASSGECSLYTPSRAEFSTS